VPDRLVSCLPPWDLKRLEPFNADFLSGFKTERYGIGLREGFGEAKNLMQPEIVRLINRDIGGNHQRISSRNTQYDAITFKHLLLPMWVAHYRYQDRVFHILVNGRTGRISGERPWSAWKIFRLMLIIAAALLLIAALMYITERTSGKGEAAPRQRAEALASASPLASPPYNAHLCP